MAEPRMRQSLDRAIRLAHGDLESFIVRAHGIATEVLKEQFPQIAPVSTAAQREEMLRSELPATLWHDLKRLRIIRNKVEHENFQPTEGDRDITLGTIKNLAAFLHEETPEFFGKRRDWQSFQKLVKQHFEGLLGMPLVEELEQQFPDGQRHHFDLASADGSVLIECKSYTWTKSGKEPAAKLNHARTDAQMLKAATAKRKLLVFEDDLHPKTRKSLAELFARRNQSWLGEVEVWRCLDGEFQHLPL
jgi:hypothetical protein